MAVSLGFTFKCHMPPGYIEVKTKEIRVGNYRQQDLFNTYLYTMLFVYALVGTTSSCPVTIVWQVAVLKNVTIVWRLYGAVVSRICGCGLDCEMG